MGMLYELCSICKGTGYFSASVPATVGGLSGEMVTVKDCHCKQLRVVETGLTSGQAERLAKLDLLRQENGLTTEMLHDQGVRKKLEAYRAEHPADEDEPVTEAWLRSVGFCVYTDCGNGVAIEMLPGVYLSWTEQDGFEFDGVLLVTDDKRSHVYKLSAAFGITLK